MIFVSCSDDDKINKNSSKLDESLVSVITDYDQLNNRLKIVNERMQSREIYGPKQKAVALNEIDKTTNYVFDLVGKIATPLIDGVKTQATHVCVDQNLAYVSYNLKGDKYLGGIDIINISNPKMPIIMSSILIDKIDISSLALYDGKLYAAGAVNPELMEKYGYKTPAIAMEIVLKKNLNDAPDVKMSDIQSYVATDICLDNQYIYVTSGTEGGLTVLNHDFEYIRDFTIADARSVAVNDSYIYVLDANDSQVKRIDKSLLVEHEAVDLDCTMTADSKSEICLTDNYIISAMNEAGVDIRDINGNLKQHFNRPATFPHHKDEDFVSNSVSVINDLFLIGNGAAGMYAGVFDDENDDKVQLMGSYIFEGSANFVTANTQNIFVASGTDGLNIIKIEVDNGVPDDIISTKPCKSLLPNMAAKFAGTNLDAKYPELFKDNLVNNITLVKESSVYITFLDETAGYKNSLAYYTYDINNPPMSEDEIELKMLFPNASKVNQGGGLKYGDMLRIGDKKFPENTGIGFCLIVKGWKNGHTVDGEYRIFTHSPWNHNGSRQHFIIQEKGCNNIVMGIEDLRLGYGSDRDFDDVLFAISDSEDVNTVCTSFDMNRIPLY